MALIKCRECGEKMSDFASHCPHCGFPLDQVKKETTQATSESRKKSENENSPYSDKVFNKMTIVKGYLAKIKEKIKSAAEDIKQYVSPLAAKLFENDKDKSTGIKNKIRSIAEDIKQYISPLAAKLFKNDTDKSTGIKNRIRSNAEEIKQHTNSLVAKLFKNDTDKSTSTRIKRIIGAVAAIILLIAIVSGRMNDWLFSGSNSSSDKAFVETYEKSYDTEQSIDYSWIVGSWSVKTPYGTVSVWFGGNGKKGRCSYREGMDFTSVHRGNYYVENNTIRMTLDDEPSICITIEIQSGERLYAGGGYYYKRLFN